MAMNGGRGKMMASRKMDVFNCSEDGCTTERPGFGEIILEEVCDH